MTVKNLEACFCCFQLHKEGDLITCKCGASYCGECERIEGATLCLCTLFTAEEQAQVRNELN